MRLESGQEMRLIEALKDAPSLGIIEFSLPSIKGQRIRDRCKRQRESREVRQQARALSVICKPSVHKKKHLPEVRLNALYLEEIDPPEGIKPVSWILVTSLSVDSFEEAQVIVNYYLARWGIETFFHVLKTGCKIEELQFERGDRLLKCISLYLVVSWRILYVMMMGRVLPDLPCDVLLDLDEWQCAYTMIKKVAPPEKPPSLGEMIQIIAQLGGYLGRTKDGPPGPKVIWKGLQKIYTSAEGWRAHREMMSRKSYG